eukprot:scaffold106220_cov36-Prasinocladus_malaysianus.AAC.1
MNGVGIISAYYGPQKLGSEGLAFEQMAPSLCEKGPNGQVLSQQGMITVLIGKMVLSSGISEQEPIF